MFKHGIGSYAQSVRFLAAHDQILFLFSMEIYAFIPLRNVLEKKNDSLSSCVCYFGFFLLAKQ